MIRMTPAGDSDFDSSSEEDFEFFGPEETFDTAGKQSFEKPRSRQISSMRNSSAQILDDIWNTNAVNDLSLRGLESAINSNNVEAVKHLLDDEVSPNTVLKSGWSVLMYATYFARSEIVDILLAKGVNVNYANLSRDTALHTACKSNVRECNNDIFAIVKALVQGGADPTCQDCTGKTPLMYAARKKLSDVVSFLLELDCVQKYLNLVDEKGWTVVDWAAIYGNVEILTTLAGSGMEISLDLPSSKMWPEHVIKIVKEVHFKEAKTDNDGSIEVYGNATNLYSDDAGGTCDLHEENFANSNSVDLRNLGNTQFGSQCSGSFEVPDKDKGTEKFSDYISMQNKCANSEEDTPENTYRFPTMIIREDLKPLQYETYGQLELFLLGLDLSYLIPLFKRQDVRFEQLLCLSMDDLDAIGVSAFGTQKRILSAIHECHEKNTKVSNLPDCTKAPLTTESLLRMMSGASEQVEYIASCMRYIKYHIEIYPDTLKPEADGKYDQPPIVTYREQVYNMNCSIHNLAKSVKYLKIQADKLEKAAPDVDFTPPGIITSVRQSRIEMFKHAGLVSAALVASLALSGFCVWREFKAAI